MTLETVFEEFPDLLTDRFSLRMPTINDAEDFFAIKSLYGVTSAYGKEPYSEISQVSEWISLLEKSYLQRTSILWAIVDKSSERVAGDVTVWNIDLTSRVGELGYELHPDFWGKGVAFETASEVVEFGFREMELNRIEACPLIKNEASSNLLLKLGFTYEGNLRQRIRFRGSFFDQAYYSILRSDRIQRRR